MAKSLKGITRIEYEGVSTKGWMVRITREGNRKQKFFNDKSYGSKAKSLTEAKKQYQEWLVEVGPVLGSRDRKTARNSTGVVGVHVVRNVDSRWKNAESFGYCASWVTPEGQRRKVSFAWNRYGKKASWEMARMARAQEIVDRETIVTLYHKKTGKKKFQTFFFSSFDHLI